MMASAGHLAPFIKEAPLLDVTNIQESEIPACPPSSCKDVCWGPQWIKLKVLGNARLGTQGGQRARSTLGSAPESRVVDYPLGVGYQNVATLPSDRWCDKQSLHGRPSETFNYALVTVTFIYEFGYLLCSCNSYTHAWIQLCFLMAKLRLARKSFH